MLPSFVWRRVVRVSGGDDADAKRCCSIISQKFIDFYLNSILTISNAIQRRVRMYPSIGKEKYDIPLSLEDINNLVPGMWLNSLYE